MRKYVLILLCFTIIAFGSLGTFNYNKICAEASAQSEIAMELSTGKVLVEGNSDKRLPMASTTKILTAIIIIEDCNLEEVITVPDEAVGVEGSSIYLKQGEEINIIDLLYGLMLRSGNDSATALAIHHSGSIENFAAVMTERAKQMGAANSNFKNPSGLPDNEHYTTARDLCNIACYAMKNQTFAQIVSTNNYNGKFRSFASKNKMLNLYEGANGIKTGYTLKAGRCLVSSAQREGMDVICVVLNCPDMYERSSEILDYCFENYRLLKLSKDKIFMCDSVLCKLRENENIVVKNDENIDIRIKSINNNDIENDGAVAELEIYNENNLLFSIKLYSI